MAAQPDPDRTAAFARRMVEVVNGASTALGVAVGDRLGLFDAMAGKPPATSQQIADAVGFQERYVREWLNGMVVARIVDYDPGDHTYQLPPDHVAVTTAAGAGNVAAITRFFPMLGQVFDQVCETFVAGGGIPYASYTGFTNIMANRSATRQDASLIERQVPLVDGIVERLAAGIDVADMGCGAGHAVHLMAEAWPRSSFTGYDISQEAVALAQAEAEARGLTNAAFVVQDVSKLPDSLQFDFITTFDAVHDQADPLGMLRSVARALRPGAAYLCVDIGASSNVEENLDHPLGPFGYTASLFHCMQVSLAEGGAGLGTMWGEQKAREMFAEAGFVSFDVHRVEGDILNNYYVARVP